MQALVVFSAVEHATQAMGRLQNFPIWGRPLRLCFADGRSSAKEQDGRPRLERPSTAPPKERQSPSHPQSASRSSGGSTRRNLWQSPVNTTGLLYRDTAVAADKDASSSEHIQAESAVERFDRFVMQRLHAHASVPPPARPDGPRGARKDVGSASRRSQKDPKCTGTPDRRLSPSRKLNDLNDSSDSASVALRASPAWKQAMPEHLHDAHIPSESTIEEHSDTLDDGEEEGAIIGDADRAALVLGISESSDVEGGSEVTRCLPAQNAYRRVQQEMEESSDSSGGSDAGEAVVHYAGRAAEVEDEEYGDDGLEGLEAMRLMSLWHGNGEGAEMAEDALSVAEEGAPALKQVQDALNVTRYMKELEDVMGSLNMLQQAEAQLQAASGALHQDSSPQETRVADEDALMDVASRLDAVQAKLSHIPPEFLAAVGAEGLSGSTLGCDSGSLEQGLCQSRGSSVGRDEISEDEGEHVNSPLRHDLAWQDNDASSPEGTADEIDQDDTEQESEEGQIVEAAAEDLQMRLKAQNLQDSMLTSELQRELQELSNLRGQISYLKGMLKNTKKQQRLLLAADADEAHSSPSIAVPTEDEGCDQVEDGTAGLLLQARMYQSSLRPPAGVKRSAVTISAAGVDSFQEDGEAPRPNSRLSEGRPQSRMSEGRSASRLSWADETGARRYLPNDDSSDFPCLRPTSRLSSQAERPTSRLSRLSGSNTSELPAPDADELDAILSQSRAEVRDIRMAVLFSQTLSGRTDRLHFLSDFVNHFQGQHGGSTLCGLFAAFAPSAVAARTDAASLPHGDAASAAGVDTAAGSADVMQFGGNVWTAADQEEGLNDGEVAQEENEDFSQVSSAANSSFSGLGSAAWSKFSTLTRRSPLSGSISVGLGSLGSGIDSDAIHSQDPAMSEDDGSVAIDSEQGSEKVDVTELQVLNEIRSLPSAARTEALHVIRRLSQGVGSLGEGEPAPSKGSVSPHCGLQAGAHATASPAGRARFTKLTDSEDGDEDVMEEVPPGGAGVEEIEDDENATASSWNSVDDVSDDAMLTRPAHLSQSARSQTTPQRRPNYFVDNLDLESPNKVPDDTQPRFDDDSDDERLQMHSSDLVLDVQALAREHGANAQKSRSSGKRDSGSSSCCSAMSAGNPALPTPANAHVVKPRLYDYDYAESVSSSTVSGEVCSDDGRAFLGRGSVEEDVDLAYEAVAGAGDEDRDVGKELRRRMNALVLERKRIGFLHASFTHPDLEGLTKSVMQLLRKKGLTVDEQLRSMLRNALFKYQHTAIEEKGENLVRDVSDILQKERVFYEVLARMRRGWEHEMRDYQQYPDEVRASLIQQLQNRQQKELMRLEKERRARGHSQVQNVHSDSLDDSASRQSSTPTEDLDMRESSRTSSETDATDFTGILDAVVGEPRGVLTQELSGTGSRSHTVMYGEVSSSAECASQDTHSSSRGRESDDVGDMSSPTASPGSSPAKSRRPSSKDQSQGKASPKGMQGGVLLRGEQEPQQQHGDLSMRIQEAEFEEITIADLPSELPGADRKNVINFVAGGMRIPSGLAKAIEQRRSEEREELRLGKLAEDFAGEDKTDPILFAAQDVDWDSVMASAEAPDVDQTPSPSERKARLLELAAMQNEMLAAVSAMSEAMAAYTSPERPDSSLTRQHEDDAPSIGETASHESEAQEAATTVSYAGSEAASMGVSDEE